jgi:hypothetical protein
MLEVYLVTINAWSVGHIFIKGAIRMNTNNSFDQTVNIINHCNLLPTTTPVISGQELIDLNLTRLPVTNIQAELNNRSLMNHNHDERYALIHDHPFSNINHLHDERYALTNHSHSEFNHNHDNRYALIHDHPFSNINHLHDNRYALIHDHPFASINHNHSITNITNLQTELNNRSLLNHSHNEFEHHHDERYSNINHNHSIANITNLQTELNNRSLVNHSHNEFEHHHEIEDIKWLRENLLDMVSFNYLEAEIRHTENFAIARVEESKVELMYVIQKNLERSFEIHDILFERILEKSDLNHEHSIANITNLQTELNNRSLTGHTHTIANISNLQNELNNRSLTNHSHTSFNNDITIPSNNINFTLNSTTANHTALGISPNQSQSIIWRSGGTSHSRILGGQGGSNFGFIEISTAGTNAASIARPIWIRQFTQNYEEQVRQLTLLNESGNTVFPGSITSPHINITASSTTPTAAFGAQMRNMMVDLCYPIGTLYMNALDNRNPSAIFGRGTWTRQEGFIYATRNSNANTSFSTNVGGLDPGVVPGTNTIWGYRIYGWLRTA